MSHVPIMGATTGGVRGVQPPKFGQTPNVAFWWGSGVGNRLHQTGYTFLNFFSREGQCNTSDQEIGPPTLKTWLRPWFPLHGLSFSPCVSHAQTISVAFLDASLPVPWNGTGMVTSNLVFVLYPSNQKSQPMSVTCVA